MILFNLKKLNFFIFFSCVTFDEKIWDYSLSSEKQGHLSRMKKNNRATPHDSK